MGSMARLITPHLLTAAAWIAVLCAPAVAQTAREVSPNSPTAKEIHPVEMPVPFSLAPITGADSIEFRSADQMSQKDRDVEADAESSIGEHAGFEGLGFNQGKWSYEQVVCPALPNHMFLRFKRNNGTGDVSIFSVSIPRNSEGRVRVIPIQKRGYSLWSPAPINAITISAFNHIRAEEHYDAAPKWLGTALCYAALAGGHPQGAFSPTATEGQKVTVAMPAQLAILNRREVFLSFADTSATPRPMQWTMVFDTKGKLLKAGHKPAGLIPEKVIHPTPVVVKGSAAHPAQGTADPVASN